MQGTETPIETLEEWSCKVIQNTERCIPIKGLIPLKGDASFRKYFRLYASNNKSYIVAFSPPQHERNDEFFYLASHWLKQGIRTPYVFSFDREQGFFLLEDFGSTMLQSFLVENGENEQAFLQKSISVIYRIQTISAPNQFVLPKFNTEMIQEEFELFRTWIVKGLANLSYDENSQKIVEPVFNTLMISALDQPVTTIHKDFHSKNLACFEDGIGVLDFQDAATGPVTYDLVSLLRDCYVDFPQSQVYQWLHKFTQFTESMQNMPLSTVNRWFDWMGMQRHIKASGIFARQWILNNNDTYLKYLPRVFGYMEYVCLKYQQLIPFWHWIETQLLPIFQRSTWWNNHIIRD